MSSYSKQIVQTLWEYQAKCFPRTMRYFDRSSSSESRPPVFKPSSAGSNVLVPPNPESDYNSQLLGTIPERQRHRWFRSMKSSQALAQSVFGNLLVSGSIDCLRQLQDDDGFPFFGRENISRSNFCMEFQVDFLGEPRKTSLDAFIGGEYQVAIECKLTENDVGTCSRPKLRPKEPTYNAEYCDGTYWRQRRRKNRCSLSEIGVLYWNYIPSLFRWDSNIDINPCPLNKNYQLVRNILAACYKSPENVSPKNGHALLVFDERNPSCTSGKVFQACSQTRNALRDQGNLRQVSWQRVARHMKKLGVLDWLTGQLNAKYGIE